MAGHPKQEVYLYDTDGKYLRSFESISQFARTYQLEDNIFSNRKVDVYEFEDGRIAALYRIGREGIKKYRQYKSSPYTVNSPGRKIAETKLNKADKNKIITVTNLDGETIAEFKNSYFAKKLMKLDFDIPLKCYTDDGLKFDFYDGYSL